MNGLAHRYALALFQISCDENVSDIILNDLHDLTTAVNNNPDIQSFIINPQIHLSHLTTLWKNLTKVIPIHDLIFKLLTVLLRHKRMSLLKALAIEFKKIYNKHNNILSGEVISAIPLSETFLLRLQKIYENKFGCRVNFIAYTDSSLIAGIVINMGSFMIDTSIKTRLVNIKTLLNY